MPPHAARVLGALALLALAILALVPACGGGDPGCATAACLGARAVQDWPKDTAGVTARVVALPDELTRTAVVGALCNAYPGQTEALCHALPPGISQDRCERLNKRPHLSFDPNALPTGATPISGGAPAVMGAGGGGGIVGAHPPSLPEIELDVPKVVVDATLCADAPDTAACLDTAAAKAATAGSAGRADATCARHTEQRWADECRFHAAEEAIHARHGAAYATAAALCGRSVGFRQECWAHILTRLPKQVPPPDGSLAQAQAAIALAQAVTDAWTPAGADAAAHHLDRFWALYFANSYRQTNAPDGTPLDLYPAAAWPHIRASLTMRLQEHHALSGPLADRVATVQAALAARTPPRTERGQGGDLVFVLDLGAPAEDGPTAYFLGAARRPTADDVTTDVTFCVVEAAARAEPADTALLDEAAHNPDARVAAEARRLRAVIASVAG